MRQILRRARTCSLSTLTRGEGTPYGSLANIATDIAGRPLILVSRLAWHTQNLLADARASVLVGELPAKGDALVGPRVTVLGRFEPVDDAEPSPALSGAASAGRALCGFSGFLVLAADAFRHSRGCRFRAH